METYSAEVDLRFRRPRNAGVSGERSTQALVGRAKTPGSGAVLELELKVANETIEMATFLAHGCPSCIAAADWACEWLAGKTMGQAAGLKANQIEVALELAPSKRHCCLIVEDALAQILARNS